MYLIWAENTNKVQSHESLQASFQYDSLPAEEPSWQQLKCFFFLINNVRILLIIKIAKPNSNWNVKKENKMDCNSEGLEILDKPHWIQFGAELNSTSEWREIIYENI